jgi:hypothetical protein
MHAARGFALAGITRVPVARVAGPLRPSGQTGDVQHRGFDPAAPVTLAIIATQGAQEITRFVASPTVANVGALVLLSAQGGASGQPVVFASLTPQTCAVLGNIAQALAPGVCSVGAMQGGTADYAPAPPQAIAFLVQQTSIFDDGFDP